MTLKSESSDRKIRKFSLETPPQESSKLTSCGLGSWRPACLQVFASPFAFLVNLCLVNIIQMMIGSFMTGTMNTLEKRYSYNTKISSLIYTADLFFSVVVSYPSLHHSLLCQVRGNTTLHDKRIFCLTKFLHNLFEPNLFELTNKNTNPKDIYIVCIIIISHLSYFIIINTNKILTKQK